MIMITNSDRPQNIPKVSVIIPVYGVEKYIERCARSLFEQTLDNIEFLFIDDCTPDKSIDILKQVLVDYPQRKGQVVIHKMATNSGQAAVRKWGMLNATGDYLIHCDSDDWVDLDMYRAMYEKAIEDNADMVVCDHIDSDEKGTNKIIRGCISENKDLFIENLLYKEIVWNLWNKLVKREVCLKDIIYPEYNMGEDMALCFQHTFKAHKISYLPSPYYYYYLNNGSITRPQCKTIEKIYSDYISVKSNAEIVLECLYNNANPRSNNAVTLIEFYVIELLLPLSHIKKYRRLCFNTYNGICRKILFLSRMKVRYKIKLILAALYIYPNRINTSHK